MKLDLISLLKHAIKDFIGRPYIPFPSAIEQEFIYLLNKSDQEKLHATLRKLNISLPEKLFSDFVSKFSAGKLKCYDVLHSKKQILSVLKPYRRQKGILVYIKALHLISCNSKAINKLKKPKNKTMPSRGRIFSIVGADGSGKSTLTRDLKTWLSWKLTVNRYYYGIPKTASTKFITFTLRAARKLKLNLIEKWLEYYLWIRIAMKRRAISRLSQNDINFGKIVITDRFPLKEFHSMPEPMDGPRLNKIVTNVGARFAHLEATIYDEINYPDRVFVLQTNINELRKRKTDLDLLTHNIKANAVNSIERNNHIVLLNANRPYCDVKLDLKRKIWCLL
jgi:hypothetical protein